MIDSLRQAILDDAHEVVHDNRVRLVEKDAVSNINELVITHLPENCFVFCFDYKVENKVKAGKRRGKTPQKYFNKISCYLDTKIPGLNQRCDWIVCWQEEESSEIHAILLEQKSSIHGASEAVGQLSNSYAFMIFLEKILHYHCSELDSRARIQLHPLVIYASTPGYKPTIHRKPMSIMYGDEKVNIQTLGLKVLHKRAKVRFTDLSTACKIP